MIEVRELSKRYDGRAVVDRVSFDVGRGELLVLLGGSGSGKTTTLKMINRLIEPSAGSVRIAGEDTRALSGPALRRRIGYGFQQVGLFPHMSVAENVAVTPTLLDWAPERIRGAPGSSPELRAALRVGRSLAPWVAGRGP